VYETDEGEPVSEGHDVCGKTLRWLSLRSFARKLESLRFFAPRSGLLLRPEGRLRIEGSTFFEERNLRSQAR